MEGGERRIPLKEKPARKPGPRAFDQVTRTRDATVGAVEGQLHDDLLRRGFD